MPRFVVLRHELPAGDRQGTHFDLMLEHGGKLLTWALAESPRPGIEIAATKLPDHRLAYLDYEGPVSGNRGEVSRVDEGEFTWIDRDDSLLAFELNGRNGVLRVELRQLSNDQAQWTTWFSPPSPE